MVFNICGILELFGKWKKGVYDWFIKKGELIGLGRNVVIVVFKIFFEF